MNDFITRKGVSWIVGLLSFMALLKLLAFVAVKLGLGLLVTSEGFFMGGFMSVLCFIVGVRAGMAFYKKSWNGGVKKEDNLATCIFIVCGLVVALLSEIIFMWLGEVASAISFFVLAYVALICGIECYNKIIHKL